MVTTPSWAQPLVDLLKHNILPQDKAEADQVSRKARSYIMVDDEIHRRSTSGVLQRCIVIKDSKELLREVHSRVCGHHAAPKTLVGKAFDKASTG